MNQLDRRDAIRTGLLGTAVLGVPRTAGAAAGVSVAALPVHDIRRHGARPGRTALASEAIQHAIDAAAGTGGGVVYVPPGDWVTGSLHLRSHVTLHLEAGATLWGSARRADYQAGASLIDAADAVDVAIRGRGTIDGSGTSFFKREGDRWRVGDWRPGRMLAFNRCQNLLLEDVTLRNPPGWTVHPVDCDGVTIRGISILAGIYADDGPNTDGIDPDGCSRVRISDCYIQTGDDAIVLKCGRRGGGTRACRDVTVTNCVLITTETALKIGSETRGEFRNIVFSNCAIRDAGCGIGLWMRDGGLIDGWTVSNVSMTLTDGGQPIYMSSYPRSRLPGDTPPPPEETPPGTVRNVTIAHVTAEGDGAIFIGGQEEKYLEGITLEDIRITMRGRRDKPLHADPPYPFKVWGHRHSPYDIFCRYVDGLKIRDVELRWAEPEKPAWGSAIRCRHVRGLEIDGFAGRQAKGSGAPAIRLADTKGAFIHGCWAPPGTDTFVALEAGTENVSLMNNDLAGARRAVALAAGVRPGELFEQGNRPPSGAVRRA